MVTSRTIKNVARHLEEQVYDMDKKMTSAQAVSPFAQQRRQMLAQAAEVMRIEAVRIDAGDDNVVGPNMLSGMPSEPLFGMDGPEEDV